LTHQEEFKYWIKIVFIINPEETCNFIKNIFKSKDYWKSGAYRFPFILMVRYANLENWTLFVNGLLDNKYNSS
jgi:hypothetical protein